MLIATRDIKSKTTNFKTHFTCVLSIISIYIFYTKSPNIQEDMLFHRDRYTAIVFTYNLEPLRTTCALKHTLWKLEYNSLKAEQLEQKIVPYSIHNFRVYRATLKVDLVVSFAV